jgi:preprotein translocase subunit SecG
MYTVLLVIHTIIILFLIAIILLQRPDGDGLGGLGGGGSNLFSGRAAGNVLTRTTAILATLFIVSSLVLAVLSSRAHGPSIADSIVDQVEEAPAKEKAPAKPAKKKEPTVPKPEE